MGHRHNRKRTRSRHGNHPALNSSYNASIHPAKIDYNTARFAQAQTRRVQSAKIYSNQPSPANSKIWSSLSMPVKTYQNPLLPIQLNNVILQQYQTRYAPPHPKTHTPKDKHWREPSGGSIEPSNREERRIGGSLSVERIDTWDDCGSGLFPSTEGVVRFLFDGHYDFVDAPV